MIIVSEKITVTMFTDPMMGLHYESEPIIDRLKKEYADRIEFRYVMSLLVRDVSDFMTPEERAMDPKEGIRRYCRRLAGIYISEEAIGGLPINMDGFRLFDAEHRSSRPLCLAGDPDWNYLVCSRYDYGQIWDVVNSRPWNYDDFIPNRYYKEFLITYLINSLRNLFCQWYQDGMVIPPEMMAELGTQIAFSGIESLDAYIEENAMAAG